MLSPLILFQKYCKEVLLIPAPEKILVSNLYYTMTHPPIQDAQVARVDEASASINLTEFLETLTDVISTCVTLFSLPQRQIKMSVLHLYFHKKDLSFCGQRVTVFPHASRITQARRRSFLQPRPCVLAAGWTFFLRFPCKCLVSVNNAKYVYTDPIQLTTFFLDNR